MSQRTIWGELLSLPWATYLCAVVTCFSLSAHANTEGEQIRICRQLLLERTKLLRRSTPAEECRDCLQQARQSVLTAPATELALILAFETDPNESYPLTVDLALVAHSTGTIVMSPLIAEDRTSLSDIFLQYVFRGKAENLVPFLDQLAQKGRVPSYAEVVTRDTFSPGAQEIALRIQTKNLRIDELAGQLANHPVVINFPKLAIFIAAISEDMYLRYLAASLPAKQIIDLYTDEIDASENSLMLVDKSLKILRVHGPSPLKPVYIVSLEDFKALQRAQDSQSLILSVMENLGWAELPAEVTELAAAQAEATSTLFPADSQIPSLTTSDFALRRNLLAPNGEYPLDRYPAVAVLKRTTPLFVLFTQENFAAMSPQEREDFYRRAAGLDPDSPLSKGVAQLIQATRQQVNSCRANGLCRVVDSRELHGNNRENIERLGTDPLPSHLTAASAEKI